MTREMLLAVLGLWKDDQRTTVELFSALDEFVEATRTAAKVEEDSAWIAETLEMERCYTAGSVADLMRELRRRRR